MKWKPNTTKPSKKGWYITRTEEGVLQWRAWGHNLWWKQLKDGWLCWYDGEGYPIDYEWLPSSYKTIDLDYNQLPDIDNNI